MGVQVGLCPAPLTAGEIFHHAGRTSSLPPQHPTDDAAKIRPRDQKSHLARSQGPSGNIHPATVKHKPVRPTPAAMSTAAAPAASAPAKPLGMRKNGTQHSLPSTQHTRLTGGMLDLGKQWHAPRQAFRPTSGLTSYEKRAKQRVEMDAVKAKEREMKEEKEAERKVWRAPLHSRIRLFFLFSSRRLMVGLLEGDGMC